MERNIYYELDELAKQLVAVRKVFRTYESYANSTFSEVFPKEELRGAGRLQAVTFESAYFKNMGEGNFVTKTLPVELQLTSLYSFATADFNNNGRIGILAAGNFYANQINIGKSDASYGHFLNLNVKNNSWKTVEPSHSRFIVNEEVRDIKLLNSTGGKKLILVSRNNDRTQLFSY